MAWIVAGTVLSAGTVGTGTAMAVVGYEGWNHAPLLREGCPDAEGAAPKAIKPGSIPPAELTRILAIASRVYPAR